jgi:hypothetical protein
VTGERAKPRPGHELQEQVAQLVQLRTLTGCGFLMAYDDPVGLAREIAAFCA